MAFEVRKMQGDPYILERRPVYPPAYPPSGLNKLEPSAASESRARETAAATAAFSWIAYLSSTAQSAARAHFPTPSQVVAEMAKKDVTPKFKTRAAQAAGAVTWLVWVALLCALIGYLGVIGFHFKSVYDGQYADMVEEQSLTMKAAGIVCTSVSQQKTEMCRTALSKLQQNAKNEAFDKTMAHVCGDIFVCSFVRENFKSALGPVVVLIPVLFAIAVFLAASAAWKGAVHQWASRMYASKVDRMERIDTPDMR